MGQMNRKRKRKESKDKGTITSNMSTNMATSLNQSPTFSQMIAGANDCLNNHKYLLNNSQSNNQSMSVPPPQQHISNTPIIQTGGNGTETDINVQMDWMSEWLLFNANLAIFSYIMVRTSLFSMKWWWDPFRTKPIGFFLLCYNVALWYTVLMIIFYN